jgi:hypothetical protein
MVVQCSDLSADFFSCLCNRSFHSVMQHRGRAEVWTVEKTPESKRQATD